METIVKLAVVRSGVKQLDSSDPVIENSVSNRTNCYEKFVKALRIPWPATYEQIEEARKRVRRRETETWENLASQGQGVRSFNNRESNAWLRNPKLLKSPRYVDALKLRTNTFGTRMVLNRANPIDTKCRRCGMQRETLGHILGMCIHTKNKKIKRHDEIKNLIAEKTSKRCSVFVEPTSESD